MSNRSYPRALRLLCGLAAVPTLPLAYVAGVLLVRGLADPAEVVAVVVGCCGGAGTLAGWCAITDTFTTSAWGRRTMMISVAAGILALLYLGALLAPAMGMYTAFVVPPLIVGIYQLYRLATWSGVTGDA